MDSSVTVDDPAPQATAGPCTPTMRARAQAGGIYVAGPMSGIDEFNHPAFHAASARLRDAGFVVRSPAETCGDGYEYGDWIRSGLRQLLDSEAVAVLPGWETSRGARLEVRVAMLVGLPVFDVDVWVSR